MTDQSEPPQPPRPPRFTPGQAGPPPGYPTPDQPPTAQFPPVEPPVPDNPPTAQFPPVGYPAPVNYAPPGHAPDYGEAGYPPPQPYPGGYPPPYPGQPGFAPPAPRRSNTPLIALIAVVSLLLCGGVVTSGVLIYRNVAGEVKEAAGPILDPTPAPTRPTPTQAQPTELPDWPGLPTDLPGLPTALPGLPTDLPGLPTDLPGIDEGAEFEVTYEVTGDGPAEIFYTEQLGTTPKLVGDVKLPWKITTRMTGVAFVSVSARRLEGGPGNISCRATVDGKEVAKQTTDGERATTTCTKLVFN